MTRDKFFPSFLLVTALALPIVGCGSDDDDDTTPTSATPTNEPTPTATATAEPTPTATAVPDFNKWQAFSSFAIAEENDGLDYDDDGSGDNGLYAAFEVIVDTLITNVDETIDALTDYPNQEDPCEGTETGCPLTPTQAQAAKAAAHQAIEQLVSIETINTALAGVYAGGAQPQAINVYEEGSSYVLEYWNGSLDGSTWVADNNFGIQTSTDFDKTGASTSHFAGSFQFETEIGGGPQGDPTAIGFEVQDALTELKFSSAATNGALTGGGIEIVALTDLVQSLLEALDEAGVLPEDFDIEGTVAQVEDALISNSDIECSSGDPCFSVTFTYDATATTVAQ
jgi:hypothetical protein